jgi:hypothetical protein
VPEYLTNHGIHLARIPAPCIQFVEQRFAERLDLGDRVGVGAKFGG